MLVNVLSVVRPILNAGALALTFKAYLQTQKARQMAFNKQTTLSFNQNEKATAKLGSIGNWFTLA
jgi:hypothetical protein